MALAVVAVAVAEPGVVAAAVIMLVLVSVVVIAPVGAVVGVTVAVAVEVAEQFLVAVLLVQRCGCAPDPVTSVLWSDAFARFVVHLHRQSCRRTFARDVHFAAVGK